jgi:hypothetical protein
MHKTRKHCQNKNNKTKKWKSLNCSPFVKNKRANKNTCLTPPILEQMRNEYNHFNPHSPIKTKTPETIIQTLKSKFKTCQDEECWLNQIKDTNIRNKIKTQIFAPKHPKNWNENPNEWLSNYDILNVLNQYMKTYDDFLFVNPSFLDFDAPTLSDKCVSIEICEFSLNNNIQKGKTKIAFVFNLSKHNEPGSHWVSLFIDVKEKFIFYFDSAGEQIPEEISGLVKRVQKQALTLNTKLHFYQNYPLEHQYGNTECGMYALFFIITMITNDVQTRSKTIHFKNTLQKINFFKKKRIPDKYVEQLRWKYFN